MIENKEKNIKKGETKETIEEAINYAVNSKLDRAEFFALNVLPGSDIANELKNKKSFERGGGRDYKTFVIFISKYNSLRFIKKGNRKIYTKSILAFLFSFENSF